MDFMKSTGLGISLTIRRLRENIPPVVEVMAISVGRFDVLYVLFTSVNLLECNGLIVLGKVGEAQ
jgi:hypothetical protein